MSDGEYYAKIAQSEAGETAIVIDDQVPRKLVLVRQIVLKQ